MSRLERFGTNSAVFGDSGFFPALPRSLFARNTAVGVILMALLPIAGGSVISVLLAMFFGWGIIALALRRFPFQLEPGDRIALAAFTLFWLTIVVTGLFGDGATRMWPIAGQLLPFLALWTQIPRFRATEEPVDFLDFTIAAAGFGAIAGAAAGLYQTWLGERPEALAGNAAIYAILGLAMGAIAALNIASPVARRRWLAVAGLAGGMLCVVLSLTRGVWLASLPIIAVLLVYAPRRWIPPLRRLPALAGLAVVLVAAAVIVTPAILALFKSTVTAFAGLQLGDYTSSPGQRVRMYLAAGRAFAESPLWGHGIQNRMAVVIANYPPNSEKVVFYSHPHNGFFAAAIDGGLLGLTALVAMLASPIIAVTRGPRDAGYRKRLFAALVLVLTYSFCGLTQIMFKHDILDAFFVFTATVIVISVPKRGTAALN
ncbi:MAG: O-antigen ligase family protein [Methylobacterium mesophilicum]|nr:O-antigen ligase family protein [Methylobacterium mesophilicum]